MTEHPSPESRTRRAALAVAIPAALLLAVLAWTGRPGEQATTVLDPARVTVVRTPGGMLEVATLRKAEDFGWQVSHTCPLVDCGELLGKTTSEIRVTAHYTYRIPLAEEWRLRLQGDRYLLVVPPPQPSLPVAFDTAGMQIRTEKGSWLSPAAGPNREAVVRHLGAELGRRAGRPDYRQLVEDRAATTVAEFARKWMTEQGQPLRHPIEVRFTGPTPAQAARARAQ